VELKTLKSAKNIFYICLRSVHYNNTFFTAISAWISFYSSIAFHSILLTWSAALKRIWFWNSIAAYLFLMLNASSNMPAGMDLPGRETVVRRSERREGCEGGEERGIWRHNDVEGSA
jgi:hypothetical protein